MEIQIPSIIVFFLCVQIVKFVCLGLVRNIQVDIVSFANVHYGIWPLLWMAKKYLQMIVLNLALYKQEHALIRRFLTHVIVISS